MKKKLIITCSLITILLAGFPHVLYAEDVPQSFEGGYTTHYGNISELDDYFYENFVLLPYLQSDGTQYINTGYNGSSELKVELFVSDIHPVNNMTSCFIFGSGTTSNTNRLSVAYNFSSDVYRLFFGNNNESYSYILNDFYIYDILLDKNEIYLNDDLIHSFTYSSFTNSENMAVFNSNQNGSVSNNYTVCKLYYLSIYDYSADSGNGALVRSFYPARQKSNGSYGLYDAVNKIFYVSNSGTPFENPEGSDVELSLLSRIGLWLRTSLGSISEIFEYIVTEPIILFFMAVGLAGATFRWARRLVHF